MEITGKADSEQHEMLIDLDQTPNLVFYAAPMFHRKEEFDEAFLRGVVRQRSFFVTPRQIGHFADDEAHYLSFDGQTYVVMSEPRIIEGYGAVELEAMLKKRLAQDLRPLRETIGEAIQGAEVARALSRKRVRTALQEEGDDSPLSAVAELPESPTPSEIFKRRQEQAIPPAPQSASKEDVEHEALRRLADIALRDFNAQLYIVQSKPEA
jgi:hypothetical protein